ncbi:MAG: BA14K family protein [Alphaproteobacteria bacterium]|nr:BA14K family protein [Alphaproteobacteria bacterium]
MNACSKLLAVALMSTAGPWMVAPAGAVPIGSLAGVQDHAEPTTENVRCRGGGGYWRGGRGAGIGAGIVAGAIIGGAIVGSRPGYSYGYAPAPAYGYGYQPGYVEDDADDDYVAMAPNGGGAGYCAQRYRSYDPRSGTFLGYDGLRHPCP